HDAVGSPSWLASEQAIHPGGKPPLSQTDCIFRLGKACSFAEIRGWLRSTMCEPVFLHAFACDGSDAHSMFRSSGLAHLRWRIGGHGKHSAAIERFALEIPVGACDVL